VQAEVPYLVRRKTKALPVDLQEAGDKAHQIDWKRSVLLNLVTQTTYSLTVSACQREHLQSIGGNQDLGKHVVQVSSSTCDSTHPGHACLISGHHLLLFRVSLRRPGSRQCSAPNMLYPSWIKPFPPSISHVFMHKLLCSICRCAAFAVILHSCGTCRCKLTQGILCAIIYVLCF